MALQAFAPVEPQKAAMVWIKTSVGMLLLRIFVVFNLVNIGYDEMQYVGRKAKYMRSC